MKNDEKHTRNLRQIKFLKIKFKFACILFYFYCSVLCVCVSCVTGKLGWLDWQAEDKKTVYSVKYESETVYESMYIYKK